MLSDRLCRNSLKLKLCREASELEIKIDLYKSLNIDYSEEEQRLNELYEKIKEVKAQWK